MLVDQLGPGLGALRAHPGDHDPLQTCTPGVPDDTVQVPGQLGVREVGPNIHQGVDRNLAGGRRHRSQGYCQDSSRRQRAQGGDSNNGCTQQ